MNQPPNRRHISLLDFYKELMTKLARVSNQQDVWPNVVLEDLEIDCTDHENGCGQQVWIDKDFPGDLAIRRCRFRNAWERIAIGNSTTRNAIVLEDIEVDWDPRSPQHLLDASYCRAGTWLQINAVHGFAELFLRGAQSNHAIQVAGIRDRPALDVSDARTPGGISVIDGSALSRISAEGCHAAALHLSNDVSLNTRDVGVDLRRARLGQLDLHASSFEPTTAIAVDLSNSEIGTLSFAAAVVLPKPIRFGNAMICQWTWREDGGSDADWIADVLAKDNAIPARVYRAAEHALRSSGLDAQADELHRKFKARVQARLPLRRRPAMWLWGLTTGYGTRPTRPLAIWALMFLVVALSLFLAHPIAVQSDPAYLASMVECGWQCSNLSFEFPATTWLGRLSDAIVLTLEAGLPFFSLNATPGLSATPNHFGHWMTVAYSVFSWILLPAAAGAIASRLLRTSR